MRRELRVERSKLVRGYLEMKKALRKLGRHEDADDVTSYCLADNLEEATAAYPMMDGDIVKVVILKECHPENARLIAHSKNKKELQQFCQDIKEAESYGNS